MLRAALLLLLAGRRAAAGAGNAAWRVPTAEIAGGDLTKLQYFAGALSPAECATVRGLAGREQTAGIATDGGDVSRTKVRSTDLRWLARGEETEWLYERMLALAEAANWDWGYKDLDAMQELQLGVYDAAAAAHYDWHADEHWATGTGRKPQVRIVSLSVQLSEEDDYDGGELQIGLTNATKAQGSAIVFPSYQTHTVHPITRGTRISLVAWVIGADPEKFWQDAAMTHRNLLQREQQMAAAGDYSFPEKLKLRSLMMMGSIEIQVGMMQEALERSIALVRMAEEMADTDADQVVTQLQLHCRYSEAVGAAPQPRKTVEQALALCDQAARHLPPADRPLGLECRAKWERRLGRPYKSLQTRHEALGMRSGLPHEAWCAVTFALVGGGLRLCCVFCGRCCCGRCCCGCCGRSAATEEDANASGEKEDENGGKQDKEAKPKKEKNS